MKALLFLAATALAQQAAFAQSTTPPTLKAPRQTKYDPQMYEVTNNGINMSVSYIDPTECAVKFEKDAALNRWSEAEQVAERAKIPAGGYLLAKWSRSTLPLASADNFVFLVETPNGQQIQRLKPEPSISRPFSVLGTTVYTDLAVVPLPELLPDGARVFVIEASAQKRFEYVVHPNSKK